MKKCIAWMLLIFPLIITTCFAESNAEFKADGSIVKNGTRIRLSSKGAISLTNEKGDDYTIELSLTRAADKRWFGASGLQNKSFKTDTAQKIATFTGNFTAPGQAKPVGMELSLSLTDEGKARVSLRYLTDTPIQQILSLANIHIHNPRNQLVGSAIQIDDRKFPLSNDTPAGGKVLFRQNAAKTITYFPDDPARRVVLTAGQVAKIELRDYNITGKAPYMELRLLPEANQIVFDVDFGFKSQTASAETYNGVDYYASDRLHLPRYNLSHNLVQNSGFEQGLHYWSFGTLGELKGSRFDDYYKVASTGIFKGRRCLQIQGEKGQSPSMISTFAIPVETGATYTASFYARADQPGINLSARFVSATWPIFPVQKSFALSSEWKRYEVSFKAPNGAIALGFGVNAPPADCTVLMDAVQLEKGALTDYTEKPLSATLVTARRNNLFQPGEKVNAQLEVSGKPSTQGEVTLKMTDFFGDSVHREKSTFSLGEGGVANLSLPWAENLAPGLYLVEVDLHTADGYADRDFFRISIMRFQDNTVAHKNLFAFHSFDVRHGSWARDLDFFRKLGLGSHMTPGFNPPPHQYLQLMKTNNIIGVFSIFTRGMLSGKLNVKSDYARFTDADLKTIEENAYQKAGKYPEIQYWKLVNEPAKALDDIAEMKLFIRPLAAARRGILRANPQAQIFSPDPPNMASQSGIRWMDTFLTAGGKEVCDLIAIHPYRARPEEPDLDSDTATFLAMLARHQYNGDVWFDEGGGNFFMNVPAFGINVHQSLSQERLGWRIGRLTYDIGWGERVGAAYAMRYWLVGLKYSDRIKQQLEHYFALNAYLDIDLTPGAEAFVPNVLSGILGNSTYMQDVQLGLNTRCYIFDDGKKRPVAALWSYDPKMDRGEASGSVLDISKLPADVELIDFMGRTVERQHTLQLSSFPVFLRGKPGTTDAFIKALANTEIHSGDARQIVAYAQVISSSQAEIYLRNLLSRSAQGHLRVQQDEKTLYDAAITLPGNDTWKLPITLPEEQNQLPLRISFQPENGQAQVTDINLKWLISHKAAKPPVIDGDLSDWPADTSLTLPSNHIDFKQKGAAGNKPVPAWNGDADLSGTLYTSWDEQNFYLAVKVRDDIFTPASRGNASWNGDGLQIYFDSWNTAHAKAAQGVQGFDGDDQVFDIWPSPQGVQVWRSTAPDVQIAFLKTGLVPDVKSAFKRTSDGYIIELSFPVREIVPLSLKPGTVLGFAVLINDNDGQGRKRGLTFTPNGTEPYMHPDIYPTMILEAAK